MSKITVYRTAWCPFCQRAEALLRQKQQQLHLLTTIEINIIDIEQQPAQRAEMQKLSGRTSVPQIFINQKAIGGCDELTALERKGQLDGLLQDPKWQS